MIKCSITEVLVVYLKRLHKVIQLKFKYLLNAQIILNNSKQFLFNLYFLHKVSCSLSLTIKPLMAKNIHNFAEDYIYLKYITLEAYTISVCAKSLHTFWRVNN